MLGIGIESLTGIVLSLIGIVLSWWALSAVKWDKILNQQDPRKVHILVLFLAILLGSSLALFLLNYIRWTVGLVYLF
ncbi:MAG: DUF1146 domain-containing protein [Candidatus Carbobacillus altaicus]|nr:DUF1146 domain-containing protein [Candidatus Carbobacillus altaicus]